MQKCLEEITVIKSNYLSNTIIWSEFIIIDNLWAIEILVRPFINVSKACWIKSSLYGSIDEVASSNIRMGGSAINALANAINCF